MNIKKEIMLVVLASLLQACSGDGSSEETNPLVIKNGNPKISKLFITPSHYGLGHMGGVVPHEISFEYIDAEGDVVSIYFKDEATGETKIIPSDTGSSKGGALSFSIEGDSSKAGVFPFSIYLKDAKGNVSNTLEGKVIVGNLDGTAPTIANLNPAEITFDFGTGVHTLLQQVQFNDPDGDLIKLVFIDSITREELEIHVDTVSGVTLGGINIATQWSTNQKTTVAYDLIAIDQKGNASNALHGSVIVQ